MTQITKRQETGVSTQRERGLSMVDKLSALDNNQKMIDLPPDKAVSLISKHLIRVFAYLGHKNLFKGDDNQRESARQHVREVAGQILSGLSENRDFRLVTDKDFDSIISKGTADALIEIKHVSPKSVFDWIKDFQSKYQRDIVRARQRLQNEALEPDPTERERKGREDTILSLFTYLKEGGESEFSDLRQFWGHTIASLVTTYSEELPESFVKQYSKRSDLWVTAQEDAEREKFNKQENKPVEIIRRKGKPESQKSKVARFYCYLLLQEFSIEEDQETLEMMLNAHKNFYQKKSK